MVRPLPQPDPPPPSHGLRRRGALWAALGVFAAVSWVANVVGLAEGGTPGEFVVIVNRQNPVTSATREFLGSAFLKKVSRWDGGEIIQPADQSIDLPVRRKFSEGVVRRPVGAVRAYRRSSGSSPSCDLPPLELDSRRRRSQATS